MTTHGLLRDGRIPLYLEAIQRLKRGEYELAVPVGPDEIGRLGEALCDLASALENRNREAQKLDQITARINAGLLLDDILENVYHDFRGVIPYNRIGFSLIENDGQTVRARWAKSDQPEIKLMKGYAAPLEGSSLQTILTTGRPRILNDLAKYLEQKPDSKSTRLIVAEGIRSSLTCPLIADGVPVGFIFFSSIQPNTYADAHVETFSRIAGQLSVIVEKGRLVSELSEQKAAIERQNEELRRLNDLKNTFLGIAAHDLRNPIGAIQTSVDLLMDPAFGISEADRASLLERIGRYTRHMLTLLNDLLEVTQIESGKLSLNLEPVNLRGFLDETVQQQAMLAAPKGTRVLLEVVPEGTVVVDSLRLRQVVDNLISNAVKFSPPGSTVRVNAERILAGWQVNVQDEGPGVTEQDRNRLFQDFARLSAKPTGDEKSAGLGLAISRRVVEVHGGRIGVNSEPGHGATFWFTLPDQEMPGDKSSS
jgi:signal transduction histidine kinase